MNTQTYIIKDIHPKDAHYWRRDSLIGKKATNVVIDDKSWVTGWCGTSKCIIEDEGFQNWVFYAVKLQPVKSFWQKLFTWSW